MEILLVEDNKRLSEAICEILRDSGYSTDAVFDGDEAVFYATQHDYDVIVLDVMLPEKNGLEVVSEIRQKNVTTPVLMLTALDTVSDKVSGLDRGADDYMTKPFVPAELLARIRSLSRRSSGLVAKSLEFGDVALNLETCELSCGEKSVELAAKEFDVMRELLLNKNGVTQKENLIFSVWGQDALVDSNNVEAYISFLRKKLKFIGSKVRIATRRMIGYQLEEE